MVYGYARVSTKGQAKDGNSLEAQESALRAAGAAEIYSDAFTGTKSHRPELVQSLLDKGITVHVLNMGLMDNTPTGKLIRNIMLAFAEFERDMIVERTGEGKAIARQREGFREGRPPKYGKVKIGHALELLESHSYSEVVEMTGISKSTLLREKRKREEPPV